MSDSKIRDFYNFGEVDFTKSIYYTEVQTICSKFVNFDFCDISIRRPDDDWSAKFVNNSEFNNRVSPVRWHHDNTYSMYVHHSFKPITDDLFMFLWSNVAPTELRTAGGKRRVEGIKPGDLILFNNSKYQHRMPINMTEDEYSTRIFIRVLLGTKDEINIRPERKLP